MIAIITYKLFYINKMAITFSVSHFLIGDVPTNQYFWLIAFFFGVHYLAFRFVPIWEAHVNYNKMFELISQCTLFWKETDFISLFTLTNIEQICCNYCLLE